MNGDGKGLVGKEIAHYRVLKQLGVGGMGEVYLAQDTNLDRKVALKVLHPGSDRDGNRLARFRREAKALASINHPGIVTVYSVEEVGGLEFITMEVIEGTTLTGVLERSWVNLEGFFKLAIPLADALSVAHEAGITHRDLKPGNIMVTPGRAIKILDFGLAKYVQPQGEKDDTETMTKEFQVVGTAGYMSPEQLRGEAVDARSDIFSLGIILYEMATGRRPFSGKSSMDLASATLMEDPRPPTELAPDMPRHLGRIISQCLEKDPEDRFQTARDVHNQLKDLKNELQRDKILKTAIGTKHAAARRLEPWMIKAGAGLGIVALLAAGYWITERPAPAPAPIVEAGDERPRIVVLPFTNLGGAEDQFFADGITGEITSRLAMVRGLSVISRTTAVQIGAAGSSMAEIGRTLGVGYVLEGTVRWSQEAEGPSRVRVTPQLIRVSDDSHVWAATYDEVLEDVFEVQSAIAEGVIDSLGVNLLGSARDSLGEQPTKSIEAYQVYLRAKDWARRPLDENQQRMTVELLQKAVELDPDFGLAWAALAEHHARIYFNSWDPTSGRLASAESALRNAERLLPADPRSRLASGYYRYYGLSDYAGALEDFEGAVAGLPNDTEALQAVGFVQRRLGRLEQALDRLSAALELDPHNIEVMNQVAETSQALRRYEDADARWLRAIALAPDRGLLYVRRAENELLWRGDLEAAHEILRLSPDASASLFSWDRVDFVDSDLLARDFDAFLERLAGSPQDDPVKEARRQLVLGFAARLAGRAEDAAGFLDAAHDLYEKLLFRSPDTYRFQSSLGLAHALLGNAEEAILAGTAAAEGDAADLYTGPLRRENLAAIYAWTGDLDRAVDLLGDLLGESYQGAVSPAMLALDPVWDPLRRAPRFRALLASR